MIDQPAKPVIDLSFPHQWKAEVLVARPLILPPRRFVYPRDAEEVENGALEVLVQPNPPDTPSFLATCALGFRDAVVPTGLWSAPNPEEICAVSGGYAYIINVLAPERFAMIPYRPVLQLLSLLEDGLLLFIGHHTVLAWNSKGQAWQTEKLSDEGVSILGANKGVLHLTGWRMQTDRETQIAIDLRNGSIIR